MFSLWELQAFLTFQQNFVRGLPLLNYPNVCTNSPQSGKAFCAEHVQFLTEKHPQVPTDIHGFLKYCGVQHGSASSGNYVSFFLKPVLYLCSMVCITCASKE